MPTATLVTEGFMALANASAKARAMASLPIVCLHRDLEYLPEDQVIANTDAAFAEIVGKLVRRVAKPAAT
ncbi:MAG: hypothetical protein ABIH46_02995 [Chloroflexota bacterium]